MNKNPRGVNLWNKHLASIKVVRQVTSIEDARDPKTIEWCIEVLNSGKSWEELRRMIGVGSTNVDGRWRAIRRAIYAFLEPEDEAAALRDYYVDQAEHVEELKEQKEEINKKIEEGASNEGEEKGILGLYSTRNDLMKEIANENHRKLHGFFDKKKLKEGYGKYAGAKINIYSNVPRPKEIEDVKEILEVKEDISDE